MKTEIIFGSFLFIGMAILINYFNANEVEYVYPEPVAYVDGANPPNIEHWEMY